MGDGPFAYEDALAWLASHPLRGNPSDFSQQARRLGSGVVPTMVEVLAKGPAERHAAAGLVLLANGVHVSAHGDTPEDFEYRIVLADGQRRVVRPLDSGILAFGPDRSSITEPTLDEQQLRGIFLRYAVLFVFAGGFAYLSVLTSGPLSIVLAILAGLLSAVALWSTLFMSVIGIVIRIIKKSEPGGQN